MFLFVFKHVMFEFVNLEAFTTFILWVSSVTQHVDFLLTIKCKGFVAFPAHVFSCHLQVYIHMLL